jgi:cold shock CspA family protein
METSNTTNLIDLTGKIKFFNPKKGYGAITKDIDKLDLFFHISNLEQDNAISVLAEVSKLEGEPVKFRIGVRNNKGEQATNVRLDLSKRSAGFIVEYDEVKGAGIIADYNTKERYNLHFSGARGFTTDKYLRIEQGEPVVFTPKNSRGKLDAIDFVLIDDRYPLEFFSEFKDLEQSLKYLASAPHLAETKNEYWDFIKEPKNGVPVLFSYINQIFSRIKLQDKIVFGKSKENKEYAYFNTGLVTAEQDEIYAYFIENPEFEELLDFGLSIPKWFFLEFNTDQSKYSHYFSELPKMATFFDDTQITQLIFDTSIKVKLNKEHLKRRKYRFPDKIKNLDDNSFYEEIERALILATKRARRNYKTAIPHFFENRIQILLPLCITSKSEADVALVVDKVEKSYVAHTILTLDQAFNNARLLAKPDREWLTP